MNEIKVAENKTLKLTNVVARRIAPEELGNMMVALTQLQNFIKSHNAQPIGPLVQALKIGPAPEHVRRGNRCSCSGPRKARIRQSYLGKTVSFFSKSKRLGRPFLTLAVARL